MTEIFCVGAGGFIGANLRYGLTKLFAVTSISLPMGTLLSNIIAGFFIGVFIAAENITGMPTGRQKLFLTTGLLGGLSTFSAFSLETVQLFQSGRHLLGVANVGLNLCLSILGVILGMAAVKLLLKQS